MACTPHTIDGNHAVRYAQPTALPHHASVRDCAKAAIGEASAHFLLNAQALCQGVEPELVHQARVGLRRLRVFVRLFRSRIGKQQAAELGVELRWLFVVLGGLRDLHVFDSELLPTLKRPARAVHALQSRVHASIHWEERELVALLAGERYRALCRDLRLLYSRLDAPEQDSQRARPWLRKRLARMRKRVLVGSGLIQQGDLETLHGLRKKVKALRYTAELASGLHQKHPRRARKLLRRVAKLQTALGGLMDLHVTETVLLSCGASGSLRAQLEARIAREREQALRQILLRYEQFA